MYIYFQSLYNSTQIPLNSHLNPSSPVQSHSNPSPLSLFPHQNPSLFPPQNPSLFPLTIPLYSPSKSLFFFPSPIPTTHRSNLVTLSVKNRRYVRQVLGSPLQVESLARIWVASYRPLEVTKPEHLKEGGREGEVS